MRHRFRPFAALAALALVAGFALVTPAAQAAPQVQAGPTAQQLLDAVADCDQISHGTYETDEGEGGAVPVCQTDGAVFYTADMDIDCDGQRTTQCNENTDCCFYPDTAFHTSGDKPLNAAKLPYVVLPSPSSKWDYGDYDLDGGSVVAIVYNGHVEYAVVGDTGPTGIIGEASYAAAKGLGIDPDPSTGGTDGPVTYIVFPGSSVDPIEDHGKAVSVGQRYATDLVNSHR